MIELIFGFKVPVHVSNDGVIASYYYTVRAYGNRELCETLDTRRYLVRSGPVRSLSLDDTSDHPSAKFCN